ncbi:MAG: phosphate/phosphite/phosphonate ABC transporter substrate-binding protein [Pseudomonadota bacterium]
MTGRSPKFLRGMLTSAASVMLAGSLLATPFAAQADDRGEPSILTFGIVPQQSASRLAQMWGPLLERAGQDLGLEIRFKTTRDIPTFEACLAAGAYDIAYMNPAHYTIFAEISGYRAIARQTEKKLHGLLVVQRDSALQSIADLEGSEIAFPSPGAFGASIVPRAEIRAQGVEFSPRYVRSHDSVYRAVASGLIPAGGGVLRTFNAIPQDLRDQLRVIYRTEGYTPHAIAGLGSIDLALLRAIQETFVGLSIETPDLVASVGMNGIEAASHGDWDDVRGLALTADATGISTEDAAACPSG